MTTSKKYTQKRSITSRHNKTWWLKTLVHLPWAKNIQWPIFSENLVTRQHSDSSVIFARILYKILIFNKSYWPTVTSDSLESNSITSAINLIPAIQNGSYFFRHIISIS